MQSEGHTTIDGFLFARLAPWTEHVLVQFVVLQLFKIKWGPLGVKNYSVCAFIECPEGSCTLNPPTTLLSQYHSHFVNESHKWPQQQAATHWTTVWTWCLLCLKVTRSALIRTPFLSTSCPYGASTQGHIYLCIPKDKHTLSLTNTAQISTLISQCAAKRVWFVLSATVMLSHQRLLYHLYHIDICFARWINHNICHSKTLPPSAYLRINII